jgi:hypothetical protein
MLKFLKHKIKLHATSIFTDICAKNLYKKILWQTCCVIQEMDAVKSYRAENLWIGNAVDGSGGGGHNSFEKQSTFVRNNVDKASTVRQHRS